MIIFKPAAALLALGLSGWIGMAAQAPLLPGVAPHEGAGQAAIAPPELPDYDTMRLAVEQALRERVAHDLDDAGTGVVVPRIAIERTSLRTLEARGEGTVAMPGGRAIPVDIVATWDVIDRRIDSVDYTARAIEEDLTAVDQAVRAAIAQRIGARIAGEFEDQGQSAHFELIEVQGIDYGRHRTRLKGAGVTDFGTEGVAYTPFVATLDKHTGELVDLQYELLQEDVASPIVAEN
jgi:hypothetical protein